MTPYSKRLSFDLNESLTPEQRVSVGAQLIKLTHDYDLFAGRVSKPNDALRKLGLLHHNYQPQLVELLAKCVRSEGGEKRRIPAAALKPGMIVQQDVIGTNNRLLIKKGQEVTAFTIRFIERVRMMDTLVTKDILVIDPEIRAS